MNALTPRRREAIPADMEIFKIFRKSEWDALRAEGETRGAPVDLADGFVHFSTAEQVRETARRHFAGMDDLTIAAVDAGALGEALRWEESRGGDLFPHLHAPLPLSAVLWAQPLALRGGAHVFPELPG